LKLARVLICFAFLIVSIDVFSIELENNKLSISQNASPRRGDISDYRFGGGAGYSLYISNQMDYKITKDFGEFNELIYSYHGGISKTLGRDLEVGVQFRHGQLMTLKSEDTQGSTCDFDDLQFNLDYSLNHNVGLTDGKYTFNARIGLGGTMFRSRYFVTNPETQLITKTIASVGYNGQMPAGRVQNEKQKAIIGNIGMVLGMRLTNNLTLYWETTTNISTSNKMSGNLYKRSWIPPDGYFFTGIGLYINFGGQSNKIGCPRF
jgi:hypothetical protein